MSRKSLVTVLGVVPRNTYPFAASILGSGGHTRLAPPAFPRGWLNELQFFGHLPAHLAFDKFLEGNIRRAQPGGVAQQRPAAGAPGGIELAHAPGHQIDEDVGIANFRQRLSTQFAIHAFLSH